MARKNREKTSYKVDFTDVEGNSLFPEIAGRFKVISVTFKDNDNEGAFIWKWEVTGADNEKFVGKQFSDRTSLSDGALWNLRNRLEALGVEVPSGPLDIEFEDLIGLELEAENEHRSWEGKEYNQLKNYVAVDGEASKDDVKVTDNRKKKDEEDEEDESPKKKRSRNDDEDDAPKKKRSRHEEEEDDEPKSKKKRKSEDEEDEDDAPKSKKRKVEDEEDEAPKKKKRSSEDDEDEKPSKKSKRKYSEDEIRDMEEDELQDLIDKHELKVKLSKYDTLRKQGMAVVDALEEEGLIED